MISLMGQARIIIKREGQFYSTGTKHHRQSSMVIVETTLLIGVATLLFVTNGISAITGYFFARSDRSSDGSWREDPPATIEPMSLYYVPGLYI